MRSLLLGSFFILHLLTLSLVAECNYSECAPCCCGPTFDGLYVGGNVGVFGHVVYRTDQDGVLIDNSGWDAIDNTVTAGVQAGYDWTCGNKLFGILADWNWTNARTTVRVAPNTPGSDVFVRSGFDWFTTIRARGGITFCGALLYASLGATIAEFDIVWRNAPVELDASRRRWGWVASFGTEFLVWCKFSLGAEILVLNYAQVESNNPVGATAFRLGCSDTAWVGRFLLNYRLGNVLSRFGL